MKGGRRRDQEFLNGASAVHRLTTLHTARFREPGSVCEDRTGWAAQAVLDSSERACYRRAVEPGRDRHIQKPERGGRSITGRDWRGNREVLPHNLAPDDPGDFHVVGRFAPVGLAVAAVVGGNDEHAFVGDTRLLNRFENHCECGINFGKRLDVGSSRVDLQACKLEYSIVSPK